MGVWKPKDHDGNSLNKIFAVYAAPEDLKTPDGFNMLLQFKNMVREVAHLHSWHGANGGNYANDAMHYRALADRTGIGKWFIPPRELLHGFDIDGKHVREENLLDLRNAVAFRGTFVTDGKNHSDRSYPAWYWSSSEHRDYQSNVWTARFTDGYSHWSNKDYNHLSVRPCRVEALAL